MYNPKGHVDSVSYTPPAYRKKAFNCPHCGAFAQQAWTVAEGHTTFGHARLAVAQCMACERYSVWRHWQVLGGGGASLDRDEMIYPLRGGAPPPNPDLPEEIRGDYEEAASIVALSPRGAAALLRLAIQKLCIHLGEQGKNLYDDIASLVRKGLRPDVQKALDAVRVIGNNAVHPGQMDLTDDQETAEKLFVLVNIIAREMITDPKEIEATFDRLPEGARQAIERRDQDTQ